MRAGSCLSALSGLVFAFAPAHAEPVVVASIKPIHALAAGVMEDVASPALLIDGAASEHGYALRPSDVRVLSEADVVFLVGEGLETYLRAPLANVAAGAWVVALAEVEGMLLRPPRAGGRWHAHDHGHVASHETAQDQTDAEHATAEQGQGGYDPHLWLDPENARRMVEAMVAVLSDRDPGNAAIYRANGTALDQRLAALDRELLAVLAPVKGIPYVVFHDAYQYFEARYGLDAVGAITVGPEQPPGARRLREIREAIADLDVRCVFSEPQFEPALVETIIAGTGARTGQLDPLGAGLENGPDLYFELMRNLAGSLKACLGRSD